MLVFGGEDADGLHAAAYRLDPQTPVPPGGGSTTAMASITGYSSVLLGGRCGPAEAISGHRALGLRTGAVLVTGGFAGRAGALVASAGAELYFPPADDLAPYYPQVDASTGTARRVQP